MSTATHQLTQRQTTQFWNENAQDYDDTLIARFIKLYARHVISLAHQNTRFNDDCKILDVGTGTGSVIFEFLKYHINMEMVGIDISSMMIKQAQMKLNKLGNMLNVEFLVMNGSSLLFQDESFDFVFSLMGLSWFADIRKGLKEIHRVLKTGGRVIVTAWTQDHPTKFMYQALKEANLLETIPEEIELLSVENAQKLCKSMESEKFDVKVHEQKQRWKGTTDQYLALIMPIVSNILDESEEKIELFKQTLYPILKPHMKHDKIIVVTNALVAVGTK